MDELLIRIMTRLVRVHDEMGERCFEEAAHRALVTIAQTVQVEASRKVGIEQPKLGDGVLPFPTIPSRPSRDGVA
ncbi:hypothetical protein JI749_10200 [Devosia oryziradicis]|uniref:Uncharacterized protein n=1 Tax=Devosia oryziradicis TaxID=2801335 RepID=A0ABX7BS64_9HYPH|nr:hypothetical protein [Devosia oryziradicis]QQR34758.1 hypothetical protein JI749_10200 [Devosia oryziradicis]